MAEPQTGRLPKLGERMTPAPRSTGGGGPSALSCQWCSVPLPAGETICPTCGSPGAADETMIVPDLIEEPQQDAIAVERRSADELTEW